MYLGDNLLQGGISDLVMAFREHAPDALILLTPVPDPQNYGVAELDGANAAPAARAGALDGAAPGLAAQGAFDDAAAGVAAAQGAFDDAAAGVAATQGAFDDAAAGVAAQGAVGRVIRLVEKPSAPTTDLALVGVYMFTSSIHDAARSIRPSARGELEITDAIQHLLDTGRRVEPHIVRGWWKDTGRLEDMLEANRLILDNLSERIEGELVDSQVDGRVVIEAGARLERTSVRGPAIIGARAVLRDCYIGPYTAVGEDCRIAGAEVEHSILLAGSSVCDLDGRMESSLLGRNVTIRRGDRQPRAYRFMVGDNSDISIL
jgi:glucose-1-phosphate thymidylyltransferase long form